MYTRWPKQVRSHNASRHGLLCHCQQQSLHNLDGHYNTRLFKLSRSKGREISTKFPLIGVYVHRPCNPPSQIRGRDSESIAELAKKKRLSGGVEAAVSTACFLFPCWCECAVMSRRPAHDLCRRVPCVQQFILCFCAFPCTLHSLSSCQCLSSQSVHAC